MQKPESHPVSAPRPPAFLLLGPTASGKTAAALQLATRLPIEIISVDSALVYQDMDIGTAKPGKTERDSCPHHLIDIIPPDAAYSAARFRTDAINLMQEITSRGRIPLLTGGTMLYFKALRDGLSDLPPANPAIRQMIDKQAAQHGWTALHAELAQLDPKTANQLAPTDAQRIQRALEIIRITGHPVVASYAQRDNTPLPCTLLPIALAPSDRGGLHDRIATRFDAMLDTGLVDEVRTLRDRYSLTPDMPSMRCVGYRQVWDYLDGKSDFDHLRFSGIVATRQLAKRQLTWQRQFRETWPEMIEIDCLHSHLADLVCETACRLLDNVSPTFSTRNTP